MDHCVQALYFCVPFREQLLEYYENKKSLVEADENLLTCLADLFSQVCDWLVNVIYPLIIIVLVTFVYTFKEFLSQALISSQSCSYY